MATTLLHRRGSTLDAAEFTGGPAELFVDIQLNKLYIHDGETRGGFEILLAADNYYTAAETDSAISTAVSLIDLSEYYTKTEVDTALANIDLSQYYTSLQVDNAFTVFRSNLAPTGHIIPSQDITYDLGSPTNRFRDLYLSGNTMYIGDASVSAVGSYLDLPADSRINGAQIPPSNLDVEPENMQINVFADGMGQDIPWLWTWEAGPLAFSRIKTTMEFQKSIALYEGSTYEVNNYANMVQEGSELTQGHGIHFKWVNGAGTQNNVYFASEAVWTTDSHPDILGGATVNVKRQTLNIPMFTDIVIPNDEDLVVPDVAVYNVTVDGNYTFTGSAFGETPNLGPWYRGGTYTFEMDASGHPLYITTDNGANFTPGAYFGEYTNGVTGSRTDVGTITITVPMDAPDVLFYQCGNHAPMKGTIEVKDLGITRNATGNVIIYAQHGQEQMFTPIELRPLPSLTTQMCIVYDEQTERFIPQDLITYIERTPRFADKIREIAGTATLTVAEGTPVVSTVTVVSDPSYLPYSGNNTGDLAYDKLNNQLYVWETNEWALVTTDLAPYALSADVNASFETILGQPVEQVDPNVYLQASFDETAGSTEFYEDVSGRPWITGGDTVISASNAIDGNAVDMADLADSMYIDLAEEFLIDSTTDTDFTLEAWINVSATVSGSNQNPLILRTKRVSDQATSYFSAYLLNGGTTACIYDDRWLAGYGSFTFGSVSVGLNTTKHYAMVKSGNTLTTYVNGQRSAAVSSISTAQNAYRVQCSARMFIDEIRLSKGAKYTGASYTVPTAPFPPARTGSTVVTAMADTLTAYVKDGDVIDMPYDLSFFLEGHLVESNTVGGFLVTRDVTIDAGAPGSLAKSDPAIPVSITLDVVLNGTPIGTVAFNANNSIGVINIPAEHVLSPGDIVKIMVPAGSNAYNEATVITLAGHLAVPIARY